MNRFKLLILTLALVWAVSASGLLAADDAGQVQLPLDVYTRLLQQAADSAQQPRPAPAGFALGNAHVQVGVSGAERHSAATVEVQLGIDILEDEWVLVPVLPLGTPVQAVRVNGETVQLITTPLGLAWATNESGSYAMQLEYKIDAVRSDHGFTLALPLPQASAINLTATLPGNGLDVSVIPAAGVDTTSTGANTLVKATIPTAPGAQISWRLPAERGHTISRAGYVGHLDGDAVIWRGRLSVEIFNDETVTLPLLPQNMTLSDVSVDGTEATILVADGRFATLVRGAGMHEVVVDFQTPVQRPDGPPRIDFSIPQIPVSRFELTLPGKKELSVSPASNVTREAGEDSTVALVHVPMTDRVAFTWTEGVPEDIRAELRANAAIYHTVHAEEGVLFVNALVVYEVTRGETNVVDLALPPGVQINRIESASGAIADWRRSEPREGGSRIVSVFLDRQLRGPLTFDVRYDRALGPDEATDGVSVPLLHPVDAQRQKGMVALLANAELTLNPLAMTGAAKVGENQLPAFVRDTVAMTVAHTYKYSETLPRLQVEAREPERVQGKFDARVDTLISLGDVTLTGAASVQVNVKSGSIMELQLELPNDVSLLNLTAPSLRTYKTESEAAGQRVDIEFTQEMEGQFRLDLTYERILSDGEPQISVPTVAVRSAEVEQGRLAVEALTAVEVQPAVTEQLSSLEVNELPQQLVLRTTNPILLAYKYVRATPAPVLALEVTRHQVLGVQEAAIDQAEYKTLFTADGLLVTTADFTVRNSRKQFLRVRLPRNSEVWSAFVDGKPEKPAVADGPEGEPGDVLIKIINSTRPFSVQLIYATAGPTIGRLGTIRATLPNPDILVTRSRWDVFLPEDFRYGRPLANMDVAQRHDAMSGEEMAAELSRLGKSDVVQQAIEPLRISVPASGVRFAFEKLYANQQDQQAWFRLPYASVGGARLGQTVSGGGALLVWLGLALFLRAGGWRVRSAGLLLAAAGVGATGLALSVYHVSPTPALAVSLIAIVVFIATAIRGLTPASDPAPTADEI